MLLWPLLAAFLFALDFANDHRFGFGPHASHQRHHGPVTTEEHFAGWLFDGPGARPGSPLLTLLFLLMQQLARLLVLQGLIGRSCCFGVARSRRFAHLYAHQLAHQLDRLGKGDPQSQVDQMLLLQGRQAARQ